MESGFRRARGICICHADRFHLTPEEVDAQDPAFIDELLVFLEADAQHSREQAKKTQERMMTSNGERSATIARRSFFRAARAGYQAWLRITYFVPHDCISAPALCDLIGVVGIKTAEQPSMAASQSVVALRIAAFSFVIFGGTVSFAIVCGQAGHERPARPSRASRRCIPFA